MSAAWNSITSKAAPTIENGCAVSGDPSVGFDMDQHPLDISRDHRGPNIGYLDARNASLGADSSYAIMHVARDATIGAFGDVDRS
jgi:hypothetical protein